MFMASWSLSSEPSPRGMYSETNPMNDSRFATKENNKLLDEKACQSLLLSQVCKLMLKLVRKKSLTSSHTFVQTARELHTKKTLEGGWLHRRNYWCRSPLSKIEGGSWSDNDDPYTTIHRICLSSNYQGQGLSRIFMSDIISLEYATGIRKFRVDTHRLNKPIQKPATGNGFEYRGIIQVDDEVDPDRLAYELNM